MSDVTITRGTWIPDVVLKQLSTFNSEIGSGRLEFYLRGANTVVSIRRLSPRSVSITPARSLPEDVRNRVFDEAKAAYEKEIAPIVETMKDGDELLYDYKAKNQIVTPDSFINHVSYAPYPLFIIVMDSPASVIGPCELIGTSTSEHTLLLKSMGKACVDLGAATGMWSKFGKMLTLASVAHEHNHKIPENLSVGQLAERRIWRSSGALPKLPQAQSRRELDLVIDALMYRRTDAGNKSSSSSDTKKTAEQLSKFTNVPISDLMQVGADNYLKVLEGAPDQVVEIDDEGLLTEFKNKYKVKYLHIYGGAINIYHKSGDPIPPSAVSEITELLDTDRIFFVDLTRAQ